MSRAACSQPPNSKQQTMSSAHFFVAASSGKGLLLERRTAAHPWRLELAFMPPLPSFGRSPAGMFSAPVKHSVGRPSSRLDSHERHIVGHDRLGEALEGERAQLFSCGASL